MVSASVIPARAAPAPATVAATAQPSRSSNNGPPRSTCFPDVPRGASATRVAAPPAEFWAVHGMYYRIPPLYDQLRSERQEQPPGWANYTQWAHSAGRQQGSGGGRCPPGTVPASRGSLAALRQPQAGGPSASGPLLPGEDDNLPPDDPRREEFEKWRTCWKTIAKRDVPRHQRTVVTQQKETVAGCRRVALTVQKEVRRKALRAQRFSMSSQIQIKSKKLVKDMGTAYKESEAARDAARKEAAYQVWRAQQPADRLAASQQAKRKAPPAPKPAAAAPSPRSRTAAAAAAPEPAPEAPPAPAVKSRPPPAAASASAHAGLAFDAVRLKLRGAK